jgi:acetoin utilization protein AcuB
VVEPDSSVEGAVQLLRRRGVRHLLVMKKDRLVGIISDRDLKRAMDPEKTQKKMMNLGGLFFLLEPVLVSEIMTPNPVAIPPDTSVHQAAFIMVERRFGALPVVEDGETLGIVTETDLLRCFAELIVEPEGRQRRSSKAGKKGPAKSDQAKKRKSR